MEVVSVITIFLLFPIHSNIQNERDQIFALFTTIPKEKLTKLSLTYFSLSKDFSLLLQMRGGQATAQKSRGQAQDKIYGLKGSLLRAQVKKRNISAINQLEKVKISHIIMAIIVIGILSIYPLVNYFVTDKLLRDFQ